MSIAFNRQAQRRQQSYEETWRATRASLAAQPTRPLSVGVAPTWGIGRAKRTGRVAAHATAVGGISLLILWELLYALLNVGDLTSTYIGLHVGLSEGNPLMHNLLGVTGFGGLIAYKMFVTVAVIAGLWQINRWHPRVAHVTIWLCNALTLAAVVLNIAQITFWR
ncbi:MAG: DUF5658 family protein [Ktedonobacterales bacterium]